MLSSALLSSLPSSSIPRPRADRLVTSTPMRSARRRCRRAASAPIPTSARPSASASTCPSACAYARAPVLLRQSSRCAATTACRACSTCRRRKSQDPRRRGNEDKEEEEEEEVEELGAEVSWSSTMSCSTDSGVTKLGTAPAPGLTMLFIAYRNVSYNPRSALHRE